MWENARRTRVHIIKLKDVCGSRAAGSLCVGGVALTYSTSDIADAQLRLINETFLCPYIYYRILT